MTLTETTDSHLSRIALALAGCRTHAADLPPDAESPRADLQQRETNVQSLLAEHARIREALADVEARIQAELREATRSRADLLRAVESHFGDHDPRMRAFRPASEARLHAPRLRARAEGLA